MSAALAGTGLSDELRLAMLRFVEVMTGSTVALLQTIVYGGIGFVLGLLAMQLLVRVRLF